LLAHLSQHYDQILIDSPPVMPVPDARILAALCDLTVMVVRAETSNRRITAAAQNSLTSVGAKLVGVVVNNVPRRGDGYYSSYAPAAARRRETLVPGYGVEVN
jgi:Mrp family chromosome partitioning ATPase